MTRKDYILLAAAIAATRAQWGEADTAETRQGWYDGRAQVANAICHALAQDNAAFDRARFLKAAGVQS
jgi:hypothetical protein